MKNWLKSSLNPSAGHVEILGKNSLIFPPRVIFTISFGGIQSVSHFRTGS